MTKHDQRTLGRAKNAVLNFLEHNLYVPKIFLDAEWNGHKIDVLAIDRDGSGDVYLVVFYPSVLPATPENMESAIEDVEEELEPLIDSLLALPAQFKYIAAVNLRDSRTNPLPGVPHASLDRSYDPDGIGRIGYLSVDPAGPEDPIVKVVFKPERFRAKVAQLAGDYLQHHSADWEIRP